MPDKHSVSQSDAAHIQSNQAKEGGDMTSGGFASRAESAGDRNANAGAGQNTGSQRNSGSGGTGRKK